jgi:catechol 2,3-dioxygenase
MREGKIRDEGRDMDSGYTIPQDARIGHVHLKVSDIQRSLDFYCGLLGFELTTTYGSDAAFISAGGYHHHIGLNVWFSKNAPPAPRNTTGLFHIAICYPTRKDLAVIFRRLQDAGYPLSGASDHGVSEALYLEDPTRTASNFTGTNPRTSGRIKKMVAWTCIPGGLISGIC